MNALVLRTVVDALERGEPVAMVTIVSTDGSTPQRTGARMAVFADGRTVGTIGGGCYEHDATAKAREAIRARRARLVRYDLDDETAGDSGLICGGRMEVFIEPVTSLPRLYIVGAGHISQPLARLASEAGFRVHVVDDRAKYASREYFPAVEEVVVGAIPEWLEQTAMTADSFVVIVTRGHRHDLAALRALLGRDLAYLGMIGSRHKVAQVFDTLVGEGVPAERLERVFAPIGLNLGAVTPGEIAVSIVAEMLAVRTERIADPAVASASLRTGRGVAPRVV